MDRKERAENLEVALMAALEGWQADLWTCMPAIVNTFDATKGTISAKPAIKGRVRSPNGKAPLPGAIFDKDDWWWAEMPMLVDVPVQFPGGGGFSVTFPLFEGDDVLVVFANRCIDAYWQNGSRINDIAIQAPELRMHSLSDGYAIPRIYPLPKLPAEISNSAMQIRSDDGELLIELTREQKIRIVAPTIELGEELKALVNSAFVTLFNNHVHTSTTPGTPTTIPTAQFDEETMLTQKVMAE